MKNTVFYSWQSDTTQPENRYLIGDALNSTLSNHAAEQTASVKRSYKERGISPTSDGTLDMEKLQVSHNSPRPTASASENIRRTLAYHAAVRTTRA